jgi:plastocyanin
VTVRAAAVVVLALMLGGPLLAGCGARGGSSTTATTTATATTIVPRSGIVGVQVLDNRFVDQTVTITAGSTVTWTNDGANSHDVVPVEGHDFGVDPKTFAPDATYSAIFATPGSYAYYCSLHGTATRGMNGRVVVVAP